MFLLTFLVVNVADNRQRLGNNVFQAGSIAQKYNCQLTRLDFQQEEGFMSALPLGYNQIEIQRGPPPPAWRFLCRLPPRSCFRTARKPCTAG